MYSTSTGCLAVDIILEICMCSVSLAHMSPVGVVSCDNPLAHNSGV